LTRLLVSRFTLGKTSLLWVAVKSILFYYKCPAIKYTKRDSSEQNL
jgi:hypothetical protein